MEYRLIWEVKFSNLKRFNTRQQQQNVQKTKRYKCIGKALYKQLRMYVDLCTVCGFVRVE